MFLINACEGGSFKIGLATSLPGSDYVSILTSTDTVTTVKGRNNNV